MEYKLIAIPEHWTVPKYCLGQKTLLGVIVGLQYYLFTDLLNPERNGCWRYAILVSSENEQVEYVKEDEIELLPASELRAEIESELDFEQRKVKYLSQQLETI